MKRLAVLFTILCLPQQYLTADLMVIDTGVGQVVRDTNPGGLTWYPLLQVLSNATYGTQVAQVAGLDYGGLTDWYIPTVSEVEALADAGSDEVWDAFVAAGMTPTNGYGDPVWYPRTSTPAPTTIPAVGDEHWYSLFSWGLLDAQNFQYGDIYYSVDAPAWAASATPPTVVPLPGATLLALLGLGTAANRLASRKRREHSRTIQETVAS